MSQPELTCEEVVRIVSDYLEGALSDEDASRVESHLAICPGCVNYLEQMREIVRMSGMLTEEQIPEQEKERLLRAFRGWKR